VKASQLLGLLGASVMLVGMSACTVLMTQPTGQSGTAQPASSPTGTVKPATGASGEAQPAGDDSNVAQQADPRTVEAARYSGSWDTTYGPLKVTSNKTKVTGTYTSGKVSGELTGTLVADGKSVEGTWSEGTDRSGRAVMSLSKDGNTLNILWWDTDGNPKKDWTGTRD
jgi:hypothetical protein